MKAAVLILPLLIFCSAHVSISDVPYSIPYLVQQAYIEQTGDVHVMYEFEVENKGEMDPIELLVFSFPTSTFDERKVAAFISLTRRQPLAERSDELLEEVSTGWRQIPWRRHPDPRLTTEIELILSETPVLPGETKHFKMETWFTDLLYLDAICPDYAMFLIRPPYFWSGELTGPTYLTVNVIVPRGIPANSVLGQLTWPQSERYRAALVLEERGQAVVRWSDKKILNTIYWLTTLFPAQSVKRQLALPYDKEESMPRGRPAQNLQMDAYVSEDGIIRLVYELNIDNQHSCVPVKSAQIILPGKWTSLTVTMDGRQLNQTLSCQDKDDTLGASAGDEWYSCQEIPLLSQISPGQGGTIRAEAILDEELSFEGDQVALTLNPRFSAAMVPFDNCLTSIRVHFPREISLAHLSQKVYGYSEKKESLIYWEQNTPAPIRIDFSPTESMKSRYRKMILQQWKVAGIFALLLMIVVIWRVSRR